MKSTYSSNDKWLDNECGESDTMEYYATEMKDEVLQFTSIWIEVNNIMLAK